MIYIFKSAPPENLGEIAEYYTLGFLALPKGRDAKIRNVKILTPSQENLQRILELDAKGARVGIFEEDVTNNIHAPFMAMVEDGRENPITSMDLSPLPEAFYRRDAATVARELLGKVIVRKIGDELMMGKIVETEAYFGESDPASRAHRGKKNYNSGMWLPGGHIFVYMVHANWMFNITTDDENAQAVLIRAVEPLVGIHVMKRNRNNRKTKDLCNGPGKWSRAFGITRELNQKKLGGEIEVVDSHWKSFEIGDSKRIGVSADLEENFRFYIKGSKFVSRV